ncbi:helix-turn-helix domain-containing protein [Neisseria perflava]|uniref:helix-turn-helix domain-containing protein n=1 Tax=Neisseria perflava TaxID=33053 RepID=UPI00209C8299|nr:helix-turn-helix transcriptional regulator [Neisseria perflava]MCP1660130.1 transcriptional regulator with XRE-family HTH domain [Neisseria perflava]MCP1772736.1 transcriptional regulator with XRE-family HTH domain [Neisseria perflava]
MKVHEKIRKIRELKNFSQENMAEQLQMSVNGYAKIERGEVGVQMDKLEQIAGVFGMDVVDLLSLDKNMVYLNIENSTNASNYYASQEQYIFEIEKLKQQAGYLQVMLAEKNSFIEQQRQQIQTLNELLHTLKTK